MSGLFEDDPLPDPPPGPGLFGDAAPLTPSHSAPEPATPEPAKAEAGAYRVLARKYRPATFADLIGQDAMVRTLRNAFAQGRIAHAFMLTGVRGIGKTTTARIIARALNCIGPDGQGGPTIDACGVCANCTAILADRHPDVIEMDAASRTGIDDVREIIESTRFRPLQARTKVFIIDEIHMLSRQAFNALLKTLEEPPPHVKFVFATTEIRKVPVTVLSRCQRFDLRRIPLPDLAAHFARVAAAEAIEVAPDALDLLARAADGSVRDGLSLLDQAIAQSAGAPVEASQVVQMLGIADRVVVFDLIEAVMAGRLAEVLEITDRAHDHGADLGLILADLLELTHTLTRLRAVPALRTSNDLPEAERTRGAALAERLSMPVLARAWQMLLKGLQEVEAAPDRRAAAEMVLIRLCHAADLPPPADLVRRLTQQGPYTSADTGPSSPNGGGGGGLRAIAGGGAAQAIAAPPPAPIQAATPQPRNYREAVAIAEAQRDPILHAHLLHSVHLVRFAPPVIELRPQPEAPRNLASDLAKLLSAATGTRWTIAVSVASGEPTLAEQGTAADTARRSAAADHPLVRAILDAFPGARIDTVHDRTADAYGLPLTPSADDADIPPFAPPDADYFDEDPMEIDP